MAEALRRLRSEGVLTELSPVLKTPSEVAQGSLLFLDMLDDVRLLVDRDAFLESYLIKAKKRLRILQVLLEDGAFSDVARRRRSSSCASRG